MSNKAVTISFKNKFNKRRTVQMVTVMKNLKLNKQAIRMVLNA